MSDYDEDYFERGIESGVSGYSNYRWMPELTIPMAYELIKILKLKEGQKVLDFGCAKGFLVKALRMLYIDAYGFDCSEYAIESAPEDVREYIGQMFSTQSYSAIIAKDVFEHLSEERLDTTLSTLHGLTKKMFVIVPLGDTKRYLIDSYENDKTHILRQPLGWWRSKLEQNGFTTEARYQWGHIKENYTSVHPEGNGFILATRL